ncbi:MAG: hypothetical protein ACRDS0_09805 [Pseudonocardiaceae bacterium]
MPNSHRPVLAAIVAVGASLAAFGGSPTAGSPVAVPAAEMSYLTAPGDPAPGDPAAGDPAAGDPVAGNPVAGNPVAGNPLAGIPLAGNLLGNLTKVSANTASEDAIAAALKAAGVASPKRWAAEVVEYRPYAADDLGLTKLRENLLKYNPAAGTLNQILSTLLP